MHDVTLRALEFDRVVEAVRSFALTPLGTAALGALSPQTDRRLVKTSLAATSEGVTYLQGNGPFALDGPSDLEEILAVLAVENRALDAPQLTGLATFLSSLDTVRASLKIAAGGPYPALRTVVDGVHTFDREVGEIRAKINPQGEVVDSATPQLRLIRERLGKQRQRLRSTLESYLRGRETAKYLQEQVVTERSGRFVLVVRSEHRSAIPGIVHGSSGSGASLFLEPLSTVEINNDIVALEEDEAQEVHRILLGLANGLRRRALDLRHTLGAATELDVIQARASFSRLITGTEPQLTTEPRLELPNARHPLLISTVRARLDVATAADGTSAPTEPVPVDIHLRPPLSTLIVTGPNTGGKTVALKTAGLLVAMAQAGLHIPAGPDATVPVCRSIFADIGDDQSITTSLSTFSGHIANIVAMDRHLVLPSLVLLDEVGAGTDPVEGGALGAAVIDHFRLRGALVIATTHDDLLKSYASTTDGVTCAGFGFDGETYAPTYRLTYGSPGRSLALEIAARLGLARTIVDDARTRRSERETQLADHLAKVERNMESLSTERASLTVIREKLQQTRTEIDARQQVLNEREEQARQQVLTDVGKEVKAARGVVKDIVDGLRKEAEDLARRVAAARDQPRLSTGELGNLKRRALDALDAVRTTVPADPPSTTPLSGIGQAPLVARNTTPPPTVGSRVHVGSLHLNGTVVAIHSHDAEVEARGKRIHVRLHELQVIDAPMRGECGGVTVELASDNGPPLELNVIGCRVDDAIARVEKYVDQALLHEQHELRIIHGHGTGQLRRAIAEFLGQHPLVTKITLAQPEHGGDGVTVIELKS